MHWKEIGSNIISILQLKKKRLWDERNLTVTVRAEQSAWCGGKKGEALLKQLVKERKHRLTVFKNEINGQHRSIKQESKMQPSQTVSPPKPHQLGFLSLMRQEPKFLQILQSRTPIVSVSRNRSLSFFKLQNHKKHLYSLWNSKTFFYKF